MKPDPVPCGTRATLRLKKSRTDCTVVMYTTDGLTLSNTAIALRSSADSGPRGLTARGGAAAAPVACGRCRALASPAPNVRVTKSKTRRVMEKAYSRHEARDNAPVARCRAVSTGMAPRLAFD